MITGYSNTISVTTLALLLDTYSGAAAAYSLRKLRTAYTGSAIRVRRASDNAEQDIGFNGENLNTSALTSFCSGTNGFVKTWYDQSGNSRDATQATAANQPQIVSSGSVILQNSKATLDFNGTTQRFDIPTIAFNMNAISIIAISKSDSSVSNGFVFANPDPNRLYAGFISASVEYFGYDDAATKFNLGSANTNQSLKELYAGSSTVNAYRNTTASTAVSSVSTSITGDNLSIGSYRKSASLTTYYDGNIQEVIFYTSNQSSNRTGIESNINSFYSIY
jgi:hypothetical protein